jgi:nucleoside-diphosphate-sugar epimerase
MNILVTGGLGLIGHNVVRLLQSMNHTVIVTDTRTNYGIIPQSELDHLMQQRLAKIKQEHIFEIDITDEAAFDRLVEGYKPEIIIHLASFPRQKVVNADPVMGSRVMMTGLLNILETAKRHSVRKIVYTSSSMVYGDFEDYVTEDSICKPQGQYGIMKLAGEWLIRDYAKHGIAHTIVRPSAVYGPLDVEDRVISKFLLTAMRGGTLKVNGKNETLDFTYVDDAVEGIVQATLSSNTDNQTYNITKSHSVTLYKAAQYAVQLAGSGNIEVRDKDADFPSRGALDITKARNDFGFNPKVDVEEGFLIYYKWLSSDPYWQKMLVDNNEIIHYTINKLEKEKA